MAVIFAFSSQTGDQSTGLSNSVIAVAAQDSANISEIIERFTTLVRKTAHFLEYFLLGAAVYIPSIKAFRGRYTPLLSICVCGLYAATDEFHQLFVPGRAGMVIDALLDTCGAAAGVAAVYLAAELIKLLRQKRSSRTGRKPAQRS